MGLSDDLLKPLNNNTLVPKLVHPYSDMQVSFNGSCLARENKSVSKENVLNICIVYHLNTTSNSFHPRLINCLFGPVKITKRHSAFNGQGLSGMVLPFILTMYLHTQKAALGIMLLLLV